MNTYVQTPQTFPLTAAQKAIWLDQIGHGDSPLYNIGTYLELNGPISAELMQRAVEQLVAKHDALRLSLLDQTDADGVPLQYVAPSVPVQVPLFDVSGHADPAGSAMALIDEHMARAFCMTQAPLFRFFLVKLDEARYYFANQAHHIILDGWAFGEMLQSLGDLYSHLAEGREPDLQTSSYIDFIDDDARYRESARYAKDREYWQEKYRSLPLPLFVARHRDRFAKGKAPGHHHIRAFPVALHERMGELAKVLQASAYHVLLAAMYVYFTRTTERDEWVVGLPLLNRSAKFKTTLGMFTQVSAVRFSLGRALSFGELVSAVRDTLKQDYRHQRFPLSGMNLRTEGGQLFDMTLSYEQDDHLYQYAELRGHTVKVTNNHEQMPLGFHLRASNHKDKAWAHYVYNEAYFDAAEIESLAERFTHVLEQGLDNLDLAVNEFSLSTQADRELLQQWNASVGTYPSHDTIHGLFEAQAAARADATALLFEGQRLSYGELNRRANQVAHRLLALGVRPDDRVAICVERGLEMIVGLLGILKAGAGYVPIDPAYPQERISYTLQDSAPVAVLVQAATASRVAELSVPVLDLEAGDWQAESTVNPAVPGLTSANLAYVIYTSGSTGLPKGVMIEHRNVSRLFTATEDWFNFNDQDVWALFHSFAFDFSVWEIWGALIHGGQLLVVPQLTSRSPDECYALLCSAGVTILNQTPSAFRSLIAAQGQSDLKHSLRQVIFGGEALEPGILKPWYARMANAGTQLVNMYGITETTVHVTYRPLETADAQLVGVSPIGGRIPDLRLYVLDAQGQAVPHGVEGELYVGGAGVARGYLNRPELNAERFLNDPFDPTPGARMYRTGDLGRWLADGSIDYLGRNDDQVKIRGFRIELGEIQARLAACDGVREAVVIAREDTPGDKRLVAYLIAAEGCEPSAAELRTQLLVHLADYMVPGAFVMLDSLPLTTNGKLDRKALPAPDADALARRTYEAPQGELETTLARLWSELLGVEQVGRHDQFFELGGHSLLAVKLIERMRQVGLNADVGVLFGQPTLVALAAAAGSRHQVQVPINLIAAGCTRITPDMLPLVQLPQEQIDLIVAGVPGGVANVQDIYALVPLQEGILFHHQTSTDGDPYLLQAVLRMRSREHVADFIEALQQVIARHDILRTSVAWSGLDEPVQVVWREARLPVQEVTLAPSQGDVATLLAARFDPRHTRMDLTRAPMMALNFAEDVAGGGWVAVLQFHHLIDDATSLALLGQEIEACLHGRHAELAPSVPYRNYVAQTRLGISQAAHEAFFREMLADVDEPSLPFGLQDVQGDGRGIGQATLPVAPALGQRLRAQARRLGVSNASLHHLAWGQVVGHLSGRRDVVFGTVLMGRLSSGQDADRAFGMFINTLPLRVEAGGQGVESALKTTHARLAALLGHEHAPLSLAQRCSGVAAPTPLFSSLLNYRHAAVGAQSAEDAGKALSWAGVQMLGGEERTNFPLMLSVDDLGDSFGLTVQAVAGVDPQRVCGYMHRVLQALADALETQPDQALHHLAILPDAEQHLLLGDFNAFDALYPATPNVHTLFEAQVQRQPDATAVTYQEQSLSYAALNALANRIAHRLIADGIGADDRVAICAERSLEMVAGLLGILKAGAGYVPLDPAYPDERLAYMLHDSAPKVLLTQQSLAQRFSASTAPTLLLDPQERAVNGIDAQPAHNPQVTGSLAYVIYTSGSTGQPKGVAMPHAPLVNLMQWQIAQTLSDNRVAQRTLQFAALGFDVAFQEVFSTLCAGGELSLIHGDVRLNFRELFRHICEQRVQRLYLPCIALQALAEAVAEAPELAALPCALSDVITAGEQLRISEQMRALFQRLPGCRLHNHYGPTESHVTTALTLDGDAASWPVLPSIGVPVANTRIYLLDEQLQPVPLGVAGELYIGGACVARGYLHRDDLTAERFLADPFVAGGRVYKTGDLGRYQLNGEIDYLGRNDGQIKIRGFRVELGEIEARLAQHAGIRDAAVLVREDSPGDKRLVAYFTAQAEQALPGIDDLRAHLQALLPDYMIPAAYVQLDTLPLSPNGKLDRRALPVPDVDAFASREYAAPQNAIETTLAELWAQVLGVARVGRHDNFFELGGHSLLAVKLIERMRQQGLSADVRVLFGQPTLAALAAAVGGGNEVQVPANRIPADCTHIRADMLALIDLSQDELDRIVARVPGGAPNVQDIYPLAPLQQGILYHHITSEQGDPYLLQATFGLDSRAELDTFAQALQAVIDRHDITRTALLWEGLEQPVQVVLRRAELALEELRFDAAHGSVLEQLHARFDPRQVRLNLSQAPLLQLSYVHDEANQRWLAMLLFHHIAMDHTALDVISEEVQAFRKGEFAQLDAAMPYRNYVAQALLGVSQAEHEQFFREMLGDVDEPTLPFGLQEVQGDGLEAEEAKLQLDAGLCRRLRAQARHLGVSAASLHHLAWARVLASVSGRDDVVFGTVLLGRMQSGEGADRALGMFINTLPLRVAVGTQDVRAGVRATHARLTALLGHEHAPLVVAQRCSAVPASSPLFSSILNYRHSPLLESEGPQYWSGAEVIEVRERTNYPCMLCVDDQGEGFLLSVQTTGVDAGRMAAYMQTALHGLVDALEAAPHTALQHLPVLPAAERETLLETFNDTVTDHALQQTLHGLFEAQVERTPHAVAVQAEGQSLSYQALNERANRLAHHLRELGVQPDARVAICVERGLDMVIGLFAILKAGGGYVPLDPAYPLDRLAYMLQDSAPTVVLVQGETRGLLGDIAVPVVDLDQHTWQHQPASNPLVAELTPQHQAYVIYTSGSTGKPKGVINEHTGVVNRLLWMQDEYGLTAQDTVLQKTPFSFDVSVWEFFWPLFTGARLVMARPGGHKDPEYLCEIIASERVTTLHFVPSMLDVFLAHGDVSQAAGLVRVMCSGEALPGSVVRRFKQQLPGSGLFNLYGPTEAAVDVTAWDCAGPVTPDNTPIGKAIANTRMYVLDAQMQPVPLGVVGELFIGGVQVARGYLNRPDLTAERFLKDPFTGGRMYRTGDVGRFLPDGNIEYLGRNDDQVKIRGLRIELGEIQARLGEFPQVKEAAVLAREDVPGDKRLVAYYTGAPAETDALRAHLWTQLPDYMVPQVFVHLEALPLSPNGKLDRKALPAPDLAALRTHEYEAPRGDTETALARLWAELLNVDRVGRHDNFFELGGHSLLAVSLIGRMRQAGLNTDVRALFGQPTLAALAATLGDTRAEVVVPLNGIGADCARITPDMLPLVALDQPTIDRIVARVPGGVANVQDIYPLAPLQAGIFFHHLSSTQGDPYVLQAMVGLSSRQRLDDFSQGLQQVINRHDVLRTAVLSDGFPEPLQVVLREARLVVQELELDPAGGAIEDQLRARLDARHLRLDLSEAPLIRIVCAADPQNDRWLAVLMFHHMVMDHTALEILRQEVQLHLQGQPAPLTSATPYRNYVAQARLGVSEAEHEGFFRDLLGDIDEPTLPFGIHDVQGDGSELHEATLALDPQLSQRLRQQTRQLGVSAASLFHLAWAQVLAGICTAESVVFGTVLLGRLQAGEGAEQAMGLFINTLPLRVDVGNQGARAGVLATHARLTALLSHEHAPLVLAQRCSGVAAPQPLFSALLNYRHSGISPAAQDARAWEGIEFFAAQERTNYPLTLSVDDLGEGFSLAALAVREIGAQRICNLMLATLEHLVAALEHTPEVALNRLPILSASERQTVLVDFNATAAHYPAGQTIHGLFEAQVAHRPDAIAIRQGDQHLSYRQLNQRANQLAHRLLEQGVRPDDRVAICARRSLETLVGLVAILKAGACYVPIDPAHPQERIAYLLQDSAPVVVLAQSSTRELLGDNELPVIELDSDQWHRRPTVNPDVADLTPSNLAYVIYTSGSTGLPKGVMVEHRTLENLVIWHCEAFDLNAGSHTSSVAGFGFDAMAWEIWPALCVGATLHLPPAQQSHEDIDALLAWWITQPLDVSFLPTPVAEYAFSQKLQHPTLKTLLIGGDRLRQFTTAQRFTLVNNYGPTEATVVATSGVIEAGQTLHIGKPVANTQAYLLDAQLQPVPQGVAGELYVGGAGVARGYLNREEMTAERFLKDPFSSDPQARMYRTGDLARWLADGTLDYLGRNDDQVKIRGVRIELGEIETRLGEHPEVKEAVVLARDGRLVAYFTETQPLAIQTLRDWLQGHLPDYMVPAAYVRLDSLPLTANGKLDRKALPEPNQDAVLSRGYEAPQGSVEVALAQIWADVLKVERVGRHDNFFELGGHSLLAVNLIGRMRLLGLGADVRILFSQPTLVALAAAVGSGQEVKVPANLISAECTRITPELLPLANLDQASIDRIVATVPGGTANVQDIYPLAPLQEGILYHHLSAEQGDPYLLQARFRFADKGRLDAFAQALQAVIDRHDILRTGIVWEGLNSPMQVVWRNARLAVRAIALDAAQGDVLNQLHERFDARRFRVDVAQAPLMQLVYAQESANTPIAAILLFHHLAMDHTAMEVVRDEMQASLAGGTHVLGEPVPYRNYVAQARLGVSEQEHEAFFRELLGDIDEPTLPFGLQDVQNDASTVEEATLALEAGLGLRLRAQSRQLGVSAASLFHLAWAQVLAAASGKDSVVFGTVLMGRMQGGEGAERALGMFINTLPLRIDVGGQGVRASVRATHARLTALLGHEHASLALAQRCSGVATPTPLFSALLNYRHSVPASVSDEALEAWRGIDVVGGEERTNYPLALNVDELGDGFSLNVLTLEEAGAQRICHFVHTAVEQLVQALEQVPDAPINGLTVLPWAEREQVLVAFNATARAYPATHTVHALFESQVAANPQAVAAVHAEQSLTYAQLNLRANKLAHHLIGLGVAPGDSVAILLPRSIDLLVSQLAISKCAAVYVPLDVNAPAERQGFMVQDSGAQWLLTASSIEVPEGARRLDLDTLDLSDTPEHNPALEQSAETAAYIMYTSGSTGTPKGLLVPHRAISRLVINNGYADFNASDRVAFASNPAFDASTLDVWAPLLNGGAVVVVDHDVLLSQQAFAEVLTTHAVSVLWMTAGLFHQYADGLLPVFPQLRYLIVGGDVLDPSVIARVLKDGAPQHLLNGYGPTEATTFSTTHEITEAGEGSIPIGRPVGNTRTYVLDAHQQPVPVGVTGELYIGGQGVALGYLNREDLTAEKFLADPFEHGLMYRTGDLVAWRADGTLQYLGRNDQQVKIRGFRIELGEIETRLSEHPQVKDAVVLAREDEPGHKRLVAYFTERDAVEIEVLRDHLHAQLPDYMVPAAYVRLDSLPLTNNGKVDRKALPAPDQDAVLSRGYEAPQGEVETTLAQIWADVLKVEQVGRHDNFFELGGHSLLAVSLIERMRQVDFSADVRVLFKQPTLAALAAAVGSGREVAVPANRITPECERITPDLLPLASLDQASIDHIVSRVPGGVANVQDIYALAPLQEGILYHHITAEQGDPYLLQSHIAFDSLERLQAFAQALQNVVDRHDILRTGIVWEGLGTPAQVVWRKAELPVQEVTLDPADGDILGQLHARFDARHYRLDVSQAPLMRLAYARDERNGRTVAVLLFHHMALDHTALEVVSWEMAASLLGSTEPLAPAVPYRNYVAQTRLGDVEYEHEAFFREMLGDIDEPTLPFGLKDVQSDGNTVAEVTQTLPADLNLRLRAAARALGVTVASLFHLAYARVLGAVSGKQDVVFGTVLVGRMQGGQGADRALGMFINTLPLRVDIGEQNVREGVRSTHARLSALLGHEHASLSLAQRCSGVVAPAPLFSAMLNYRHSASDGVMHQTRDAWVGIETLASEERTNYPLALNVDDQGESFRLNVQAIAVDAQRVVDYVQQTLYSLVDALDTAPSTALQQLPVLPAAERETLLVAFNDTARDYPLQQTLHGLFEAQVARTPDAVAVLAGEQRLSYRQLNERANRLAHHLRELGVQPDARVAICVERGLDMVVGLFAILKAGGGYVPLDPAYPLDRLAYMLQDSAPAALLVQGATQALLGDVTVPVVDLDQVTWQHQPASNPQVPGLTARHQAYVIYTSGSTGQPKGVINEHAGVVNRLLWMQDEYGLTAQDTVLQKTPFSFDVSVWEFFWPLFTGARLVMARPGGHKEPEYLCEIIAAERVTTLHFVPSMLDVFLAHGDVSQAAGLVRVMCSGEALPGSVVRRFKQQLPGSGLFNLYGPTEAAVDVTAWDCTGPVTPDNTPIGKAIANTRMYVLDAQMQPVPLGVVGELFIGGVQVARGYLHRPELTAERFLKDPFSEGRLYRTGDIGRFLPDGNIEYLGRNDDQVKIRGLRIELGEIQARLGEFPQVKEAAVLAREDMPGDKRLVAYYTGAPAETDALRAHLLTQLPDYMVPQVFVHLEALPLSPNGKLDRKALPAPDLAALRTHEYEAPRGDTETALARLWAELLNVDRVGRHDHFFELGGHSLLAVSLIGRLRQEGIEANVKALFEQPTLWEYAEITERMEMVL